MSRLVAVAFALVLAGPAQADYDAPSTAFLVFGSDLVALGEIVELDDETLVLAIEEVLAGGAPGARVRIKRFVSWTCSRRWKPYAVGQREIVFLAKPQAASDPEEPWLLRSVGSEAEWEVQGDRVTRHWIRGPGPLLARIDEGGGPSLEDVGDAIRRVSQCVHFDRHPSPLHPRPAAVDFACTAAEFEAMADRSAVHRALVLSLPRGWRRR